MKEHSAEHIAHEFSPSEAEMLSLLHSGGVQLPPAMLRGVAQEVRLALHNRADGIVQADWAGKSQKYLLECKSSNTPFVLENALNQVRTYARGTGLLPLLFVPYLSEEQLTRLGAENVSGIDMCGNGLLFGTDFHIWRSGQPNLFRSSRPIKNIFRGVSSLVARCFLLRPRFPSMMELKVFAASRRMEDANVFVSRDSPTKATVSKVVGALVEELIVKREGAELHLNDPIRLMEKLRQNYEPINGRSVTGRTPFSSTEVWEKLGAKREENPAFRYCATGAGSAERYRLLSGPNLVSLYVSDFDAACQSLQVQPSRVFPNIHLVETTNDTAYFDSRENDRAVWASPVQAWLELSNGGPRERDAAESLAQILKKSEGETLA